MNRICIFLSILLFPVLLNGQDRMESIFRNYAPREIGPAGMSGRVTAIAVNPIDKNIIYAGTASGGLWKSVNAGTTWDPIFENESVASIGALAIDPLYPDIIWAGTGEGNPRNSLTGGYGIYRSPDAGRTWKLMGLEKTRNIHRVIVNPNNGDEVYVAAIGSPWGAHPERGVFRTMDGGKSWEKILYVNESTGAADLIIDPSNSKKLFAAMWEHDRDPWYFTSGGEGSGLYMTVDGGNNWEKLDASNGLPDGELGRIGLSLCNSNPSYVYAYVESKKNAIYRSVDGGYKWEQRGVENIGNRPFYYGEIYVDPQNENRLYTLYSQVGVSEDGGLSFKKFTAKSLHSDHHAWWIDPQNPDFIINGNDGGMGISRDRGETWRHIFTLPVAQFYHINADMERPYRVYGGMQDNGSWVGPAYKYSRQGIINTDWDYLNGGDGFDVVPIPNDPKYCYSMSQQGYLSRNNLLSGGSKFIRPVHPNGEALRFNWNAAIAQDPYNDNCIYYGSQFLHKSIDRGENWELISGDLTTNDPGKQNQSESGGLTYDATGAENHTTIIAIEPSKMEKGLIWVGTDDGNIQLTRDGGSSWTNIIKNIKSYPDCPWVPQIRASEINKGEAFVVVNNYRQNDYSPYLYHTRNYGKSWENILEDKGIWGYVLSFVQDVKVPDLMFLGTEYGLWFTLDGGDNWEKWDINFPTVSVSDLMIHPREGDLIIGTFGRSAWILDDINPLREMARSGSTFVELDFALFNPPDAIMAIPKTAPGYAFYIRQYAGDTYFEGENRPMGAMISYYIKEVSAKDKLTIEIYNDSDELVRKISQNAKAGINRLYWRFDSKGFRRPGQAKPKDPETIGGGMPVAPGEYRIVANYGEYSGSTILKVNMDKSYIYDPVAASKNKELSKVFIDGSDRLNKALDYIKDANKKLSNYKSLMNTDDSYKEIKEKIKTVEKEIAEYNELMYGPKDVQGIYSNPKQINTKIRPAMMVLSLVEELNSNQKFAFDQGVKALSDYTKQLEEYIELRLEPLISELSELKL